MRYHYILTVQQCPRFRRRNIVTTNTGFLTTDGACSEKERYERLFDEATKKLDVPATTLFYRCVPDPEAAE